LTIQHPDEPIPSPAPLREGHTVTKPSPLQPLLELMQSRMDEAARRLGELIASETEGKHKLEMLQIYRAEYQQRFLQAAASGIGPDAWRNYSAFLVKIDEAI